LLLYYVFFDHVLVIIHISEIAKTNKRKQIFSLLTRESRSI